MPRTPVKRGVGRKPQDSGDSRAKILAAATDEFAHRGLNGARLDIIARRAHATRAMIYYYYGGREALYLAALEDAYRKVRLAESKLDITHMPPVPAMRCLIEFAFDYYQANPSFVALVVAENQTGGRYIRKLGRMREINVTIIDTLRTVLDHGAAAGVFRRRLDPIDVHLAISALGFFHVANRATFGTIFRRDMYDPVQIARSRKFVVELILRYLSTTPDEVDETTERMMAAVLA